MVTLKKYIVPVLVVIVLAQVIAIAVWLAKHDISPLYQDTSLQVNPQEKIVDEQLDVVPFKFTDPNLSTNIRSVNEAITKQYSALTSELADELRNSRLYLVLSTKGTERPQSFALAEGSLTEADPVDDEDLYYSFSPNGENLVYFAVPKEREAFKGGWGGRAVLYKADKQDVGEYPFPQLEESVELDSSLVRFKQLPTISNTGQALFVGWDNAGQPSIEKAEDWSIYKVENGTAQFLVNGFLPKWINDTEFLFLKNDGIYISNITLKTQRLLVPAAQDEVILTNNMFDMSPDNQTLVWTHPNQSVVAVYKRDTEGVFTKQGIFDKKSFWVAVSPSNQYVALQTIDPSAVGTEENPGAKIEFFDLSTLTNVSEIEIDIDVFDQMYMFITEWVNK